MGGENSEAYQVLQRRISEGRDYYRFLQWALMVKEGRHAEYFGQNRDAYRDQSNLMVSVQTANFDLRDEQARREALKDTARLERAKHLLGRSVYIESMGFDRAARALRYFGIDGKTLRSWSEKESDPTLKSLMLRLQEILDIEDAPGMKRGYALRENILKKDAFKLYKEAAILVLAEGLEAGRVKIDGNHTANVIPMAYDFLMNPKYTDEDQHSKKRPDSFTDDAEENSQ